jgi:hypothetical protein
VRSGRTRQPRKPNCTPSLNRLLGSTNPTAPMSRAHAEIAYQIARLGRFIDDIGDRSPDQDDLTDLRGVLCGLHAILQLYTVQEENQGRS